MGDRQMADSPQSQKEPCGKKCTDLRRAALPRLSPKSHRSPIDSRAHPGAKSN